MTTSRAGGLHKPPWGIPLAEPIGSSNNPPLAVVAPPPQMWQLFLSLPCVKGGGTACRDGGIVLLCFATSTIPQSLRDSSLYTREPPLRRELCKAKAFWNHQHCWWFSFNKKPDGSISRTAGIYSNLAYAHELYRARELTLAFRL